MSQLRGESRSFTKSVDHEASVQLKGKFHALLYYPRPSGIPLLDVALHFDIVKAKQGPKHAISGGFPQRLRWGKAS
jgi:hypothetical protein